MYDNDSEFFLITKDPQTKYKEIIEKQRIKGITKVILYKILILIFNLYILKYLLINILNIIYLFEIHFIYILFINIIYI